MKVKFWVLTISLSIIMSSPALFFIRYSILLHQYVEWERKSLGTSQWIPSSEYANTRRIFFLENWKLPIITKSK